MARQRLHFPPFLLAATFLAGSGCSAASAAPSPNKSAPPTPRYAALGLTDAQSEVLAVGLNNRDEIVFEMDGSGNVTAVNTFGAAGLASRPNLMAKSKLTRSRRYARC